ncbi:leukocyte elastase inhibitor-like [Ixodes scapularis]|uniref:leukocyte elastase inhibitor-like n=1 Tax=Ixodes scapularis TaxID=6945 RepID=UPI001C38C18D|nr:leukocyte elastase inhibitor-like [Ixodes scapularis]
MLILFDLDFPNFVAASWSFNQMFLLFKKRMCNQDLIDYPHTSNITNHLKQMEIDLSDLNTLYGTAKEVSPLASDFLFTFSVNLYKQLQAEEGTNSNIVCSPFSIAAALSMINAGARNNTQKQISHLLHVKDPDVHDKFCVFFDRFCFLPPEMMLFIASRIYASFEFSPLEDFACLLKKIYKSSMKGIEFRGDPNVSRCQVNSWVAETTKFMIRNCLPLNAFQKTTQVVLANAVYFRGFWDSPFRLDAASRVAFHEDATTTKAVDMMFRRGTFMMCYSDELKVTALKIPYRGGKMSLVVLFPEKVDGLTNLVKQLTPYKLTRLLRDVTRPMRIELRLPKFKLEHTIDLKETLSVMGATDLFTERADLSGMSVPPVPALLQRHPQVRAGRVSLTLDHPFMFLVEHHDPVAIILMGVLRKI